MPRHLLTAACWNAVAGIIALAAGAGDLAGGEAGGYLDGGMLGSYRTGPGPAASTAFTRRDVRIDCAWGGRQPGGSGSPAFAAVPAHGFSVAWHGRLWSRFGQPYRLSLSCDGPAAVRIRPQGASAWTGELKVETPGTGILDTRLAAGGIYDIELDYANITGTSGVSLRWQCPGVPAGEVIEAASTAGLNAVTYANAVFADAIKGGRPSWANLDTGGDSALDQDGWPTAANVGTITWENATQPEERSGDYLLAFQGTAEVTTSFKDARFIVGGLDAGQVLAKGMGYVPATNTTTAIMRFAAGSGINELQFRRASRDADGRTPGVSQVRLMRPIAVGSNQTHPLGSIWTASFLHACEPFGAIRWIKNHEQGVPDEREWADRLPPARASLANLEDYDQWEIQVSLANESGKDLMLSIPHRASDDYLKKLARLIAFGSDGKEPYGGPVANPVWPPLNPNLRAYIERSNEVWNFLPPYFLQAQESEADARDAVDAGTADGLAINYDGRGRGNWLRWNALRTVRASDAFRSVCGDQAMGNRIRVVLETQYDNAYIASQQFLFLDRYFNNIGGSHVAVPRPPLWFIWGSGGAQYYGSGNPLGLDTVNGTVGNGGFEDGGTGWSLAGGAAPYASRPDLPVPGKGTAALALPPGAVAESSVDVAGPGMYALRFRAVASRANDYSGRGMTISINGANITPCTTGFAWRWTPGASFFPGSHVGTSRSSYAADYATIPVRLERGACRITLGNTCPSGGTVFGIDDLRWASAEAIRDGGMPGNGQAAGQEGATANYVALINAEASYPLAYGLGFVGYEGGWSIGGDSGSDPLQQWAKHRSSWAASMQSVALGIFEKAGGSMSMQGTYELWPATAVDASGYPMWQGIVDHVARAPNEAGNGFDLSAPVTCLPGNRSWVIDPYTGNPGAGDLGAEGGNAFSWHGISPRRGRYRVEVGSPRGAYWMEIDGRRLQAAPSAGNTSWTVVLGKGIHAFVAKAAPGSTTIASVRISPLANRPPAVSVASPAAGLAIADGSGLPVAVTASDPDGSVARVQLWLDGRCLGEWDGVDRFPVDGRSLPAGTHVLVATAYDDFGDFADSDPVTILVGAAGGGEHQRSPPATGSGSACGSGSLIGLCIPLSIASASLLRHRRRRAGRENR